METLRAYVTAVIKSHVLESKVKVPDRPCAQFAISVEKHVAASWTVGLGILAKLIDYVVIYVRVEVDIPVVETLQGGSTFLI